jgi:hypothetical protein
MWKPVSGLPLARLPVLGGFDQPIEHPSGSLVGGDARRRLLGRVGVVPGRGVAIGDLVVRRFAVATRRRRRECGHDVVADPGAREADVDGPALDAGLVVRVACAKGALDGLEQAERRHRQVAAMLALIQHDEHVDVLQRPDRGPAEVRADQPGLDDTREVQAQPVAEGHLLGGCVGALAIGELEAGEVRLKGGGNVHERSPG